MNTHKLLENVLLEAEYYLVRVLYIGTILLSVVPQVHLNIYCTAALTTPVIIINQCNEKV
jgi:hypothetical protein